MWIFDTFIFVLSTLAYCAEVIEDGSKVPKVIPNQYIVTLKGSVLDVDNNRPVPNKINGSVLGLGAHLEWIDSFDEIKVINTFDIEGITGYIATIPNDVLEIIANRMEVEFIEADQKAWALGNANKIRKRITRSKSKKSIQEENKENKIAAWGQAGGKGHRKLLKDSKKGPLSKTAGEGVDVYVLDTGINIEHGDFEDRAAWGRTVPFLSLSTDENGHGTHCAARIGGLSYGIAKKANLVAVKVLRSDGQGSISDVIKGLEWTLEAAKEGAENGRKSIASMSLGSGISKTLDNVINKIVDAGLLHIVVASGNDSCNHSPSRGSGAISVGVAAKADEEGGGSVTDGSPCVDLFAPGNHIESAWIDGNESKATLSGSSMACSHVTGVLALYLSDPRYADMEPAKLKAQILDDASSGLALFFQIFAADSNLEKNRRIEGAVSN